MSDSFVSRAERIVDALLESDPSLAMWSGDHRGDGRLPDFSADAVASRASMLREASHVLTEVDEDDLGTDDAVDLELLTTKVSGALFDVTELREHEWNPLVYNPGMLLNTLLTRPSAPVEDRLSALVERLNAIPDSLATAKSNLSDIPAVYSSTGAAQFRGTAGLIGHELPGLAAQVPGLQAKASAAGDQAVAALRDFADWLSAQPDGRSPRLGRALWEAKLWHRLDTPVSAASLLKDAYQALEETTAELHEAAGRFMGEAGSSEVARAALLRSAADRPGNDTVLSRARDLVDETTRFVRDRDLVSLIDDPLEIVELPAFARGVTVAYVDAPGALETAKVPTFYAISPAPDNWSAEQVESYFSEYNNHMLANLTVHEAMPGHYLQLAHARRYRGRTRVRQIGFSGTFVEGWAVYAEEMMQQHGYGGPEVAVQRLKMKLRMIINVILDQQVHCEDMDRDDALHLMTVQGHQSEREAAGKWDRARLSSTQLSTYFAGYREVARIADSCPSGRPDRAWHDAMLSHGSIPPRHVATLMGV